MDITEEFTLQSGETVQLSMLDMMYIAKKYRVLCTAEYIAENSELDFAEAIKTAEKVREEMDNNSEILESTAISMFVTGN